MHNCCKCSNSIFPLVLDFLSVIFCVFVSISCAFQTFVAHTFDKKMDDVRELFVARRGVVEVVVERDYSNRRTLEDLYDVQRWDEINNDYCQKRFGKEV